MYIGSLNLRRTVQNCLQLTPAIALSVVPTICIILNSYGCMEITTFAVIIIIIIIIINIIIIL